ncbi:methionyl-tRNA formyltransferase [Candidatus Parcubacteria bacterium]|nr:methionyl-tRNA formyltransferase [Candidatus Parcubacteria bacterium]
MISFVFFGTSEFAVYVLDELKNKGFVPSLVVTRPDKPQGRKLLLHPSPVKIWAKKNNVSIHEPLELDSEFTDKLQATSYKLFIVASYGKIIPDEILNIPSLKTLNVHPSLLPKLRGASPLQTAILKEEKTGVSVIRLDSEMDHGPIIAQKEITISPWPPRVDALEETLGREGGKLLADAIPDWEKGKLKEMPQDDTQATYTKKISKDDGRLDLNDDPFINYKKIQAYYGWPGAYFFIENKGKKMRVIVKDAVFSNATLEITRVIPEGKNEMSYADFKKWIVS